MSKKVKVDPTEEASKILDDMPDMILPTKSTRRPGQPSKAERDRAAVMSYGMDTGVRQEAFTLPLTSIHPDPKQVRRIFNEDDLNKLAESIRHNGIIIPLSVVRQKDGTHICLDAERRFRAAHIIVESGDLGLLDPHKIPVHTNVSVQDDDNLRQLVGMIANEARKGNTESEKAIKFAELNKNGMERELLLQRTGLDKASLSKYISIGTNLSNEVLDESGVIGMSQMALYALSNAVKDEGVERGSKKASAFIKSHAPSKPSTTKWVALIKNHLKAAPKRKSQSSKVKSVDIGKIKFNWVQKSGGIQINVGSLSKDMVDDIKAVIKKHQGI